MARKNKDYWFEVENKTDRFHTRVDSALPLERVAEECADYFDYMWAGDEDWVDGAAVTIFRTAKSQKPAGVFKVWSYKQTVFTTTEIVPF